MIQYKCAKMYFKKSENQMSSVSTQWYCIILYRRVTLYCNVECDIQLKCLNSTNTIEKAR